MAKIENMQVKIIGAIVVLVLLFGGFIFLRNIFSTTHAYLIKNNYYGFELKTPKGWTAQEKTYYTPDKISNIFADCQNDKSNSASVKEIGVFRFESHKYGQDINNIDPKMPSGIILDFTVNCIPENIKSKVESSISENSQVLLLHGNFEYRISKYIYISLKDKQKSESAVKNNLSTVASKIISSIKFVK